MKERREGEEDRGREEREIGEEEMLNSFMSLQLAPSLYIELLYEDL